MASSVSAPKTPDNRKNIYLKNPHLWDALRQAVDKGLIQARSGSERLEELLETEIRRIAPQLRRAGIQVPAGIFPAAKRRPRF